METDSFLECNRLRNYYNGQTCLLYPNPKTSILSWSIDKKWLVMGNTRSNLFDVQKNIIEFEKFEKLERSGLPTTKQVSKIQ